MTFSSLIRCRNFHGAAAQMFVLKDNSGANFLSTQTNDMYVGSVFGTELISD